jgi:uncharacterized protein YmfQ (DUF2313 family)
MSEPVTQTVLDKLERFLDMSAPYWRENLDMQSIFAAYASLIASIETTIDETLTNERFVASATEAGIALMELQYGLPEDETLSLEDRRARLLAAKRKTQNVNEAYLKNVAGGLGLTVEIVRNMDGFVIEVDVLGEDKPIDEGLLYKTFREIIPAYLDLLYRVKIKTNLILQHVLVLNEVRAPMLNQYRMTTTPGGL